MTSDSWLCRLAARHLLVELGGECVALVAPYLSAQIPRTRGTAEWVLRCIADDTTRALARRAAHLLCPTCIVRCAKNPISVPGGRDLTYFGCRNCGRSRELLQWPGQIVAVLDTEVRRERAEEGDTMRVNWSERGRPFDFDRVEIVSATDDEAERFTLVVGNDTDEVRRARYTQMRCLISTDCGLSENSMRILRNTFGEVEVGRGT